MHSLEINGEGESRGQPANLGSPGKMDNEMERVCVYDPGVLCRAFSAFV